MSGTPVTKEIHYRFRSDSGGIDAAPSWFAAEDTPASINPGTNFRLRVAVQNTGTASDIIAGYALSVGGFNRCGYDQITWSVAAGWLNGADASSSADAAGVTVQRLTSGTGSFATSGVYDENEDLASTITAGTFNEVETGMVLTGGTATAGIGGGETFTFKLQGLTNAPDHVATLTTPNTNGSDFQHGAQLGGNIQKVSNSATISMTTAAAASSGNLVVVVVACDNNGTSNADLSEISGVTIGGVAATKAKEITNGSPGAQAGVTCSVWYLQLTGDLASGSTITATFTTAATSGDCNTIQAREFIVASGKTVSVEATNSAVGSGISRPASLDCTTSNIECLRIAAHACEDGTVNTATSAASYVALTKASSSDWSIWWTNGWLWRTTGSAATDISNFVEANISTGTGKASLIGDPGVSTDWASCYVAFKATTSTQTLTPSLYTDSDTFFAPTVGRGAVTLTPSLYSDSDTFFAPKVSFIIYASLFSDGDTFYTPTVTQGAANLQPSLFSDGDTFYTPTVGRGTITLTPSLFSDGDSFYAPKVSFILAASLYSDADTFHTPTVTPGAVNLTASLYSDADSFYSATVGRGAVTLAPSLYTDGDTFFSPTVAQSSTLAPSLFSDGDTFYTPTVTPGAITLQPSLYSDADSFYSPRITLYLVPSLVSDGDTFYTPTVARGAVTLQPSLYSDADSFYSPTVTRGAVTLTPSLYSDGDTFYTPTVSLQGSPQELTPSLFSDGDTFYTPTVGRGTITLQPSLYSDADSFYAPTAHATNTLTPSLFSDGDTFHTATVGRGTVTLSPSLFSDGDTFFSPTVSGDGAVLQPSLYSDADTFYSPTVTPGVVTIAPSLYSDGDTFHAPDVTRGAVNLTVSLYSDGDTFYSVVLAALNTLTPSLYSDADTFFASTVEVGPVDVAPSLYEDEDTFFEVAVVGPRELTPDLFVSSGEFYDFHLFISYGNVVYPPEEDRVVVARSEDRIVYAVERQ